MCFCNILRMYLAALQGKPDKYEYHNRLAFAWLKAGKPTNAMEEFLWCLAHNPKNGSEMAGNIANLNMYRKEYSTALRWFQLSKRLDPTDSNSRFNLAVMAVQELKDASGRVHPRFGPFALVQLEIAAALDPQDEAAKARGCWLRRVWVWVWVWLCTHTMSSISVFFHCVSTALAGFFRAAAQGGGRTARSR